MIPRRLDQQHHLGPAASPAIAAAPPPSSQGSTHHTQCKWCTHANGFNRRHSCPALWFSPLVAQVMHRTFKHLRLGEEGCGRGLVAAAALYQTPHTPHTNCVAVPTNSPSHLLAPSTAASSTHRLPHTLAGFSECKSQPLNRKPYWPPAASPGMVAGVADLLADSQVSRKYRRVLAETEQQQSVDAHGDGPVFPILTCRCGCSRAVAVAKQTGQERGRAATARLCITEGVQVSRGV